MLAGILEQSIFYENDKELWEFYARQLYTVSLVIHIAFSVLKCLIRHCLVFLEFPPID